MLQFWREESNTQQEERHNRKRNSTIHTIPQHKLNNVDSIDFNK
jgi:hypothetical protein